jgi:enoyl-CoA hydratase
MSDPTSGSPAPGKTVTCEIDDGVAVIRFDDGKANVLTPDSVGALNGALDQAESDAAAVALIGRPGRFSAGFDLSIMQSDPSGVRDLLGAGAELAVRLFGLPIPVVLGVTGHALAMGALLLLSADVRIGTEGEFKIGLNEVAIGMPVPRFGVELARARLTSREFTRSVSLATIYDPDGAVDAGYLDEVARSDDVAGVAVHQAKELAGRLNAPAFRATRENDRAERIDAIRTGLAADLSAFAVSQ